jgi:transcriptional regulator with XRE-family HTH domain
MAVKERITLFIKSLEISKSEFCRQIGVSNAYISSIRKSIQQDKVQRIALKYPELNIEWLLTGDGEMLKNSKPNPIAINDENEYIRELKEDKKHCLKIIEEQSEIIRSQQKTIERLERELDEKRNASVAPEAGAECANVG